MSAKKTKVAMPVFMLVGLVIGIICKLFVIDILKVSGVSMESTLHDNSVIAVNKLAFGLIPPLGDSLIVQWRQPKRDDIIIYLYDNKIVVKRCVAVAGDHLDYSADSEYSLKVGGKEILLTQEQYNNLKDCSSVPDGYIFAVGDNYSQSIDSRAYGFIPVRNVLGKILWK